MRKKNDSGRFPDTSVADAFERSLRNAKDLKAAQSALVATCRVLANRIDFLASNDFLSENEKFDNVTVPTFLKYLDSLGLTIHAEETKSRKSSAGAPKSVEFDELARFREKHKQTA